MNAKFLRVVFDLYPFDTRAEHFSCDKSTIVSESDFPLKALERCMHTRGW